MAHDGLMVSVSGIRGRVGEALTPEIVASYAAGFAVWALKQKGSAKIVVGRDSRVSGPMFHRVTIGALQSVGASVIDNAHLSARGRGPPRRGRDHALGESQPDRVERAEVYRTERTVPRRIRGRRDARDRG